MDAGKLGRRQAWQAVLGGDRKAENAPTRTQWRHNEPEEHTLGSVNADWVISRGDRVTLVLI